MAARAGDGYRRVRNAHGLNARQLYDLILALRRRGVLALTKRRRILTWNSPVPARSLTKTCGAAAVHRQFTEVDHKLLFISAGYIYTPRRYSRPFSEGLDRKSCG